MHNNIILYFTGYQYSLPIDTATMVLPWLQSSLLAQPVQRAEHEITSQPAMCAETTQVLFLACDHIRQDSSSKLTHKGREAVF